MADTALPSEKAAMELAQVLTDHSASDVVVLDVAAQAGWTDRFVIATATSSAHLRGLGRFVEEKVHELGLQRLGKGVAADDDDEWLLIDLGIVVVHLMTERSRSFYELEKLWFESPVLKVVPKGSIKA
jgi:ribosome-associated protein